VAASRAVFEQGRADEAAALLDGLAAEGGEAALRVKIMAGALRGRIAAARGAHGGAVRLARQAAALSDGTDDPCLSGDARFDLAIVARAAGRPAEAAAAGAAALARYEAKGAALPAGRVRDWLAAEGGQGSD
jgi:hypothetical protein